MPARYAEPCLAVVPAGETPKSLLLHTVPSCGLPKARTVPRSQRYCERYRASSPSRPTIGSYIMSVKSVIAGAAAVVSTMALGLAGAASVSAGSVDPGQGGSTVITFSKGTSASLKADGVSVKAVAPAQGSTGSEDVLTLPVSAFDLETADTISHVGGMRFSSTSSTQTLTGKNPLITITGATTGTVSESISNYEVPVMLLKKVQVGETTSSIDTSLPTWMITYTTVVTAKVYVTNNAKLVAQFNEALDTDFFVAGARIGKSTSTLTETIACSKNTVAACEKS